MVSPASSWVSNVLLPWTYLQGFFCESTPTTPYQIPAEWTPHRRTLMAWPERISVDRDDQLHHARSEIASIAEMVAKYEPLWLYASPESAETAASWISSVNVTIKVADLEEPWMRSTGPSFAESADKRLVGLIMGYIELDSKSDFSKHCDTMLASRILGEQQIHRVEVPFGLGGSGPELDGAGTVLVSESPFHDLATAGKGSVERRMYDLLGIQNFIWLPTASSSDVRHLTRFAPNNTVLLSRPNIGVARDDPSWNIFHRTREHLQSATNAAGHRLRIVEIEEALTVPCASFAESRQRPATSYLEFYLPNGAVIVPQFGDDRANDEALRLLKEVWPERLVVGVKVDMLAWMDGGVHSATKEWPLIASDLENAVEREDEL